MTLIRRIGLQQCATSLRRKRTTPSSRSGRSSSAWSSTAEVEQEARSLAQVIDEIGEHGAEVKDLDEGLIDFPARRRGETVLLCWKLGEDRIRYWHTVEDGFAGRRPLPLD